MKCRLCPSDTRVLQTTGTQRRRECLVCKHRFNTTEIPSDEKVRMDDVMKDARELARKITEAA